MNNRNRKECLKEIGVKEYNFNIEYEEALYLYHCGMKLSRSQWRKLDGKEIENGCSYLQWENHVKQKFSDKKNPEFMAFLRQFLVIKENFLETGQIICAALMASLFTAFASVGENMLSNLNNSDIGNLIIISIIDFAIIAFLFLVCSIFAIKTVKDIIFRDKARKNMCQDIIEILKK